MLSYQDILIFEYERRVQKNSHYSRRAFARDLSLSASFLSQILTSKKKLSPDKASIIVNKIQCSQKQKDLFLTLVRLADAKSDEYKATIRKELSKKNKNLIRYKELKHATFQVVANWHYHALLALTELDGFIYDIAWISKKLGVSSDKVSTTIKVLKNLNLVKEIDGTLKNHFQMLRVASVPSRAIREHHHQFLELADTALRTQTADEIDISGSTIAINIDRMPEARKLIKEFRENMIELLDDAGKNTQVYRLSVQLFRVDKKIEPSLGTKNESR